MRNATLYTLLTGAILALPVAPASAVVCYTILDRSENVVYRDTIPPVDLSDQGVASRERLRQRGEHLMWMDSELCPTIVFFTGMSGSPTLSIDQVIAGFPALTSPNAGAPPLAGSGVGKPDPASGGNKGAAATAK